MAIVDRTDAMTRMRKFDRLLLCTLLPLWAVWWTSQVYVVFGDRWVWWPLVDPPDTRDQYPQVAHIPRHWKGSGDLRVGDEVVRIGEMELRGANQLRVTTAVAQAAVPDGLLSAVVRRAGVDIEIPFDVVRGRDDPFAL